MSRDQGLDLLTQQACDVKSEEQRFTCKKNKIVPVKDSGLCVTASGNCFTLFSLPLKQNLGNRFKTHLSTSKCLLRYTFDIFIFVTFFLEPFSGQNRFR